MSQRHVWFTETAKQHVDRERTWWLANRDQRELFAAEVETAVRILAVLPGAGSPYCSAAVPQLRRIYLRKIGCHLYYTYDEDQVIVRALWGARRERGPSL